MGLVFFTGEEGGEGVNLSRQKGGKFLSPILGKGGERGKEKNSVRRYSPHELR